MSVYWKKSESTEGDMLRKVLTLAAGLIGVTLLSGRQAPVVAQGPLVRQEIHSLAVGSPTLVALRKAVLAMKALPRHDRRNWYFMANIHGFPANINGEPTEAADQTVPKAEREKFWATCQHASEIFLPWHRAELLTFERIVRELSGDPKFALPYWDAYANPRLPEAFRVATVDGKPNPLRIQERGFGVNDGTTRIGPTPSGFGVAEALQAPNFRGGPRNGFGGRGKHPVMASRLKGFLESPPHDHVHVSLGEFMGDPDTAGRDPIFYLHHANIDRLWTVWRNRDPKHLNPSDAWLKESIVMPSHKNEPEKTFVVKELLDTTALGYKYDNEETASAAGPQPASSTSGSQPQAAPPVRLRGRSVEGGPAPAGSGGVQTVSLTEQALSLGGDSLSVELPLPAGAGKSILARAGGPQPAGSGLQQVDVVLRGVTAPSNPGVSYFVYINLPATARANGTSGDHFLGLLNSWEIKQATRHMKTETADLRFPLVNQLAALLKQDSLNASQLLLSFVRSGLTANDGTPVPVKTAVVNVRQIAVEIR